MSDYAVPLPTIPPSAEEVRAIAGYRPKSSAEVDATVARLAAESQELRAAREQELPTVPTGVAEILLAMKKLRTA